MIAILTPTAHLPKFNKLLEASKVRSVYLPDFEPTHENLPKSCLEVSSVFLNPNRQKYFFDRFSGSHFPNLKTIFTASTGTLHIDVDYFTKTGIEIVSLKHDQHILKEIPSTAELALALTLLGLRHIPTAMDSVRNGEWDYWTFLGKQIKDTVFGVIGLGRLGKIYANAISNLGGKIIYYDPYVISGTTHFTKANSIEQIMSTCEVISLHIHPTLNPIINQNALKFAGCREVVLVNTSRGEVVDEKAVLSLLETNKHFIYATDVLSREYDLDKNQLLEAFKSNRFPNQLFVTPHLGGSTIGAQDLAYTHTLSKLINLHEK